MRKKLQKWEEPDYSETFMVLFQAFKYNPAALTSLCLLSRQYELAYSIILAFSN